MHLAASMLKPDVDDDDDDEDEVSFAPRHRIQVAVNRAPAADTPELKVKVSNPEAHSDLETQVSRLERDLGLAQGVNTDLQKSLDEVAEQSVDSNNKISELEEKQQQLAITLQQERTHLSSLQEHNKSLNEDHEKAISTNAKRNAELSDELAT